jgi:polyisoprenoid-binding protein YceI
MRTTIRRAVLGSLILTTAAALGAGAAGAAELKVDKAQSRIEVDARATGHSFSGKLDDFDAKITGDEATLKPSAVKLSWKFADLKTGDTDRDAAMLKWLGSTGTTGGFKFTKMWTDKGKNFAQGELTIHGVSKTIAFPYTATTTGKVVVIDGAAAMNYEDFGLPIVRAMAIMTVKPELVVRFHLVGTAE